MISSYITLASEIDSGRLDKHFVTLYGHLQVAVQKRRYLGLLELLAKERPGAEIMFVNAPGRTELGGNHTDHNHGCVLAAAVDLDCVAAVTPVETPNVTLFSKDYSNPISVDLHDLEPHPKERGKPEALVRGVAAAFYKHTGIRCGFVGYIDATCRPGTGLSSSAAFSVLAGSVFNFLFYNSALSAQDLAVMARDAENDFFGKPCGLMDQMASSVGNTIFIDFDNPEKPAVEQIGHTLEETGYRLAVIDTGGSHVTLTSEYAAIPEEMCAAANVLGQDFARGVSLDTFLGSVNEIRNQAGDRAALRLLHFLEENERVKTMANHLKNGKFSEYLEYVDASGTSSCCLLQNCATATSSRNQGILLALAMSRRICARAVCRVHGGGFAGTMQAYVPNEEFDNYISSMEQIFGTGSVIAVRIGRPGVCGLSY
ncbi:MAG: hypothetical protein BA866_05855, partial [Desulfobulbaceae bacterium S5133MH15]